MLAVDTTSSRFVDGSSMAWLAETIWWGQSFLNATSRSQTRAIACISLMARAWPACQGDPPNVQRLQAQMLHLSEHGTLYNAAQAALVASTHRCSMFSACRTGGKTLGTRPSQALHCSSVISEHINITAQDVLEAWETVLLSGF